IFQRELLGRDPPQALIFPEGSDRFPPEALSAASPWLTLACRPALPYLREACLAGDSVWRRPGPIGRFACRGLTLLLEQARLPLSNRARSPDPLAPLGIKRFFLPTRAH